MYEGVLLLAKLIDNVARSGKDPRSGAALQAALEASPSFRIVVRRTSGVPRRTTAAREP